MLVTLTRLIIFHMFITHILLTPLNVTARARLQGQGSDKQSALFTDTGMIPHVVAAVVWAGWVVAIPPFQRCYNSIFWRNVRWNSGEIMVERAKQQQNPQQKHNSAFPHRVVTEADGRRDMDIGSGLVKKPAPDRAWSHRLTGFQTGSGQTMIWYSLWYDMIWYTILCLYYVIL